MKKLRYKKSDLFTLNCQTTELRHLTWLCCEDGLKKKDSFLENIYARVKVKVLNDLCS